MTDPDSRPIPIGFGFVQGYNAQAAVNEQQIVLAAEITNSSTDFSQLDPMVTATLGELERAGVDRAARGGRRRRRLLERAAHGRGHRPTSTSRCWSRPTKAPAAPPAPGWTGGALRIDAQRAGLRARPASATENANRPSSRCSVTPSTTATSYRFHRRGRIKVRIEWRLLMMTHNLTKLHRHQLAAMGA